MRLANKAYVVANNKRSKQGAKELQTFVQAQKALCNNITM